MSAMPANVAVESALLSRLLVQPHLIPTLNLEPRDFYDPDMRSAWVAMNTIAREGGTVDVMTLASHIGHSVPLPVTSLTAAHHAPVDEYADILRSLSLRRMLISGLGSVTRQVHDEDVNNDALLTALQGEMDAFANGVAAAGGALWQTALEDHRQPPPDPWLDVISPEGTTILYGDGGDGKGWVAARWVADLDRKVAILDFEMHPGEWAYRLDKFGKSLDDVLYFQPPMPFDQWAGEQSARFLRRENIQLIVIDSAMYASNIEDPYSPNGALAYGRARRRLDNLPALLLAHTTGGADKVFGSVFWRNEARIVWRLNKDFATRQRHLECRKANNYSTLEGTRFNILFDEQMGELHLT